MLDSSVNAISSVQFLRLLRLPCFSMHLVQLHFSFVKYNVSWPGNGLVGGFVEIFSGFVNCDHTYQLPDVGVSISSESSFPQLTRPKLVCFSRCKLIAALVFCFGIYSSRDDTGRAAVVTRCFALLYCQVEIKE